MRPARVIAVHRYYWPDTPPYATMLRSIATRWARGGHDVTVISTQPSYKPGAGIPSRPSVERLEGVTTRRVGLLNEAPRGLRKLANMVVFPAAVAVRVLCSRRPDVVMCSTSPPVVLAVATSAAARLRRAQFVYHCMDLHPQIGALTGDFANPLVYRLLNRLDRATCRRAAAVVVLSEDMKRVLVQRDPSIAERVVVVNNFDLPDDGATEPVVKTPGPRAHGDALRLVFTGNLGRFQGLNAMVRAVAEVEGVELVLMGDGGAKPELQRLAQELGAGKRVQLLPHGSVGAARALLRTADLGLVSLIPETIRYAYPSKTMTYLAEGLPLLAVVESDSELAGLVAGEKIGYTCPPGDVTAAVEVLRRACAERSLLPAMRTASLTTWREQFEPELLLDRWDALLANVLADSRTTTRTPTKPSSREAPRG